MSIKKYEKARDTLTFRDEVIDGSDDIEESDEEEVENLSEEISG